MLERHSSNMKWNALRTSSEQFGLVKRLEAVAVLKQLERLRHPSAPFHTDQRCSESCKLLCAFLQCV